MRMRICSLLVFIAASPAFCQVAPSAEGSDTPPDDNSRMQIPALLSGIAYPSVPGEDMRSNYLAADLTVSAGYTDNVLQGETSTPLSEYTYLINPVFTYDRTTSRQQTTMSYSPGFAFYQPDSVLDSMNQNANFRFEERLSPGLAFSATDMFVRTSDVFVGSSYPFPGGVGGTTQLPAPPVIAPFVQQDGNQAGGGISYQFSLNSMVGASGSYSFYNFSSPNQVTGLSDSTASSAMGFYDKRFSGRQYIGLNYQYTRSVASPSNVQSVTQVHTFLPFYALYFNRSFSVSLAAGAQNTNVSEAPHPESTSWSPAAVASLGWQSPRTSFAFSYARVITAGNGLVGAYQSSNVSGSGAWKMARSWNAGASAGYNTIDHADAISGLGYQNGHTFTVEVSLGYTIGEHLAASLGYDRLHEEFAGIPLIAANPNTNREFVNVTYQFRKPLGR